MLLSVEGGGFFSSSASGYSNGLALLLLGRRSEEKPTRNRPWNQYRLVEQEVEPEYQLASRKDHVSCSCASFICFGCTPAGLDGPSPRKVVSTHQSESYSGFSSTSNRSKASITDAIIANERKSCLKSNRKRHSSDCSMVVSEDEDARESLEVQSSIACCIERRTVQWTDTCGKELAEIREFEVSNDGISDEESEHEGFRRCECVIQ
ncbi:uncharacterized protein [Typha angustifolia]|uniref:uncharacterized protein isoform X1 n=1 Tax=Typha angustifolia TaxID=59011 RepID=UPI003C2DB270